MEMVTRERRKQINNKALAVYRFALQKHIEFDTITDYMQRLGHNMVLYKKEQAQELNKKHGALKVGLDFGTVAAMTCRLNDANACTVYFNLDDNRFLNTENALHELGHILLNHLDNVCESNRDYYEKEANLFAWSFETFDEKYKRKVSRHNKKREKAVKADA